MPVHEEINKSIDLNIISTTNLVKINLHNKKIIFFFTSYIYPGKKGNYKGSILYFHGTITWSKLNLQFKCIKIH